MVAGTCVADVAYLIQNATFHILLRHDDAGGLFRSDIEIKNAPCRANRGLAQTLPLLFISTLWEKICLYSHSCCRCIKYNNNDTIMLRKSIQILKPTTPRCNMGQQQSRAPLLYITGYLIKHEVRVSKHWNSHKSVTTNILHLYFYVERTFTSCIWTVPGK